eukprot:3318156-Amphidinium_carterae.1
MASDNTATQTNTRHGPDGTALLRSLDRRRLDSTTRGGDDLILAEHGVTPKACPVVHSNCGRGAASERGLANTSFT